MDELDKNNLETFGKTTDFSELGKLIGEIRRTMPNQIAMELASVQPMPDNLDWTALERAYGALCKLHDRPPLIGTSPMQPPTEAVWKVRDGIRGNDLSMIITDGVEDDITPEAVATLQASADLDLAGEDWQEVQTTARYLTEAERADMERLTVELDAELKEALRDRPRRFVSRHERADDSEQMSAARKIMNNRRAVLRDLSDE